MEDTSNIKKYKNELNGLDKELKDLNDDLEDLKEEVDSLNDGEDLYEDIDDLQNDVEALRTKIKNVLDGETAKESTTQINTNTIKPAAINEQQQAVEVQRLSTMPGVIGANEEANAQSGDNWEDLRTKALLIGGIVTLAAVIVFLIAIVLF